MKMVKLGKTGCTVSELGFGAIAIIKRSRQEAVETVRHAFARGINFFDTANGYGDSEEKLGEALAPVREKVIIATKTMARDAATAGAHIELSLKRLRTDHVDLIQLHNLAHPDVLAEVLKPGGAFEALKQAQAAGKARQVGFSAHSPQAAVMACESGLFATVQVPFNFVEEDGAAKVFAAARKQGMGIIGMNPGRGVRSGRTSASLLREHPEEVPIRGSNQAELDEILGLYARPNQVTVLMRAEMARIKAELGNRFCRRCGYCQPCPQGVNVPMTLLFKSIEARYEPSYAVNLAKGWMKGAKECLQCGECLPKCPYHLPVPDLLAEYVDYYEAYCRRHGHEPY